MAGYERYTKQMDSICHWSVVMSVVRFDGGAAPGSGKELEAEPLRESDFLG
jgi:hypothetical protein